MARFIPCMYEVMVSNHVSGGHIQPKTWRNLSFGRTCCQTGWNQLVTSGSFQFPFFSNNSTDLYSRDHYIPHLEGIKHFKCMVNLWDFLLDGGLFGLVSYNDPCIAPQGDELTVEDGDVFLKKPFVWWRIHGTTWRIIPVSKWLVTPIHQPFRPFGRGTTLLRGLTNYGY